MFIVAPTLLQCVYETVGSNNEATPTHNVLSKDHAQALLSGIYYLHLLFPARTNRLAQYATLVMSIFGSVLHCSAATGLVSHTGKHDDSRSTRSMRDNPDNMRWPFNVIWHMACMRDNCF